MVRTKWVLIRTRKMYLGSKTKVLFWYFYSSFSVKLFLADVFIKNSRALQMRETNEKDACSSPACKVLEPMRPRWSKFKSLNNLSICRSDVEEWFIFWICEYTELNSLCDLFLGIRVVGWKIAVSVTLHYKCSMSVLQLGLLEI